MDINQILNFGLAIGAIFAMALQKYAAAYTLFSVLLGWVILSNFVGGESGSFDLPKIAFLGFSTILFFTVV